MTPDFGHRPERLKNWARYVVENPLHLPKSSDARQPWTEAA